MKLPETIVGDSPSPQPPISRGIPPLTPLVPHEGTTGERQGDASHGHRRPGRQCQSGRQLRPTSVAASLDSQISLLWLISPLSCFTPGFRCRLSLLFRLVFQCLQVISKTCCCCPDSVLNSALTLAKQRHPCCCRWCVQGC